MEGQCEVLSPVRAGYVRESKKWVSVNAYCQFITLTSMVGFHDSTLRTQ